MATTQTTDNPSSSHRANAQAAIDLVNAMSAGDLPRCLELWAPELKFHFAQSAAAGAVRPTEVPAGNEPHHDPFMDGVDAYVASYTAAVDKIFAGEIEPPEFLHIAADGDLVMPLVVIRTRLRDGTAYTHLYCFPMRFENGKVVEMWEVHDTAYAFPRFAKQFLLDED